MGIERLMHMDIFMRTHEQHNTLHHSAAAVQQTTAHKLKHITTGRRHTTGDMAREYVPTPRAN